MASTLRGGLSLGLCGFTFWSHFIGGFSQSTPAALYLRWLAFGVLTSHSRCHGAPPTEPWEYGEEFVAKFRRIVEMRYRLVPYIYAQAKLSSERGYPMLKALFFEYPEDPACWMIEDQYMFGEDMLVAPLMEETPSRTVYLPPGRWVDYQNAATYEGARWHRIEAGEVPAVVLVRHGGVIPRIELAQSTSQMDWSELELAVFGSDVPTTECPVCLPDHEGLHTVRLENDGEKLILQEDPLQSRVRFRIVSYE